MSTALQQRAKSFLARPVPPGLDYVPDSIAERVISMYAENGKLDDDPELGHLLMICTMEAPEAAAKHTGDARAYLEESAAILSEIMEEG